MRTAFARALIWRGVTLMRGSEFTKQAEALSDVPTGLPTLRGHCFAFFTHFVQKDAFHLRTHRTSTSFQYHKSICTIFWMAGDIFADGAVGMARKAIQGFGIG